MLIVSITGSSMKEALRQIKQSYPYTDLFEFRCDLIGHSDISSLMRAAKKPCIVTYRTEAEGGEYRGPPDDLLAHLLTASFLGAQYVDIERRLGLRFLREFIRRRRGETRVIHSLHMRGVPRNVKRVYEHLDVPEADVLKFAYRANDASDIHCAQEFLALAKKRKRKAVAIAMGEYGEASRVLYRVWGGWGTFASSTEGNQSAQGQLPANAMKDVLRSHTLDASTRIFGVIGNPLSQSKGVFLHNPLFHQRKINAVYCRFPVRNVGKFMETIAPQLSGWSVTIPHKQKILQYLSSVDKTAIAIGAVNTVIRRGNGFHGTNTDAPGALEAIEAVRRVRGKTMLILGAGGAARAIAFEAKKRGAQVLVANRTEEKARSIAKAFNLLSIPWENIRNQEFDFLVNATSIGMAPKANVSPIPKMHLRGKIVFDAVYNPRFTMLLRQAKRSGARIISGMEMYMNQAALQSKYYSGHLPRKANMKRILK